MTTLAIILGLVLLGFLIGFTSCALSISKKRKEYFKNIESLEIQNEKQKNAIKRYITLGFLEQEVISNLSSEILHKNEEVKRLKTQINNMM